MKMTVEFDPAASEFVLTVEGSEPRRFVSVDALLRFMREVMQNERYGVTQ